MTCADPDRAAAPRRWTSPAWAAVLWTTVLAFPVVLGTCGADAGRPDGLYAEIHTAEGRIVARLEPERTPLAVAAFVGLAEGTIENAAFDPGRPFYDGSEFHRVVPGHVIQAGAPASERADGPGWEFPNEIHAELSHDHAGALGVANAGPHTNGAQFYITLGDRSYLDGDYIVFGEVVEGLDVVKRIEHGDVIDSMRIARVGQRADSFRIDTERFRERVEAAERRIADAEKRKRVAERAWIARHWPDAVGDERDLRDWPDAEDPEAGVFVVEHGPGAGAAADRTTGDAATAETGDAEGDAADAARHGALHVRYRGTAVRYMGHLLGYEGPEFETMSFGSGADGAPAFVDRPRTFAFRRGRTEITPGLDAVIAGMTPGERRVVVVPPELGYGRSGFYAPPVPGEARLVISPNTMLVYEVEVLPSGRGAAPSTRRR